MKKILGLLLVTVVLSLSSCASTGSDKNYPALAREQSFDYFFSSPSKTLSFATIDEAYDWVKTAEAKFRASSGKRKAQGLSATLIGPALISVQPVTVYYFMHARNHIGYMNLSEIDGPQEEVIRGSRAAVLVFLVFYGDRSAAISNIHQQSGVLYDSNSWYKFFTYNNTRYDAEYRASWATRGADKAFSYLRKEID